MPEMTYRERVEKQRKKHAAERRAAHAESLEREAARLRAEPDDPKLSVSFGRWLGKQFQRNDAIGDLARATRQDRTWLNDQPMNEDTAWLWSRPPNNYMEPWQYEAHCIAWRWAVAEHAAMATAAREYKQHRRLVEALAPAPTAEDESDA